MAVKKSYNYQMPDWIRESISEFLGTFLQLYLVLVSLMLRFMLPNVTRRLYTDPDYCYLMSNSTEYKCDEQGNSTKIPLGKKENDDIYVIQLDALYIIVIVVMWASGFLLSLLVSVPVSGGYQNPAISVTLVTMSRLQWKKLLHYIPAQYFGAFFAAICFHVLYHKHIEDREDIILYVLSSTPHPKINMWTAMADSFFASSIFSIFLFAILDPRKDGVSKWAQPLLIVLTLFGIVPCFYADTKLQLNPARDLSTRLYASFLVGFKPTFRLESDGYAFLSNGLFSPFSYCFWWLPKQVCLYVGFLAGGWLYVGLFGSDIKEKVPKTRDQNRSDTNNIEEKYVKTNQTNGQNLKQKSNDENKN